MKWLTWILIVLIVFAFSLAGCKTYFSITYPLKYQEIIEKCATTYNLSPSLVASVINAESSFNANAKSSKNAIGLMQVKLTTANYLNDLYNTPQITENELFDVETNINYGCLYLNYLFKKFADVNTCLAAYNAGETRVRSWLKSSDYSLDGKTLTTIPFTETKNYVDKINKNLNYYQNCFN